MFAESENLARHRKSTADHGTVVNVGTIIILFHIGTHNADKEGTTAIVNKYRNLMKKTKEAWVGQIILSGILPVFETLSQC